MSDNKIPGLPEIKFNKNGYELRTTILELAHNHLWQDYHAKLGQFETSVTKEGSEIVTTVSMPSVPGVESILATAEKFYKFVNKNK
jgi:hypothetical protein